MNELKKEVITGNTVKSGKILVGDLDKYISQINDEKSVESNDLKKEPLPTIEPNQAASNKYVSEEYLKYNPYSYFDIENEMVKYRMIQPSSLPKLEFIYKK